MKTGTENRRQAILAAVLGVLALGAAIYLYEELFAGGSPAPAAVAPVATATSPAVPGTAAKAVGTTSGALDPTLHMDAMLVSESVEYTGSGRNIFSANSAPAIPIPVAPARPKPGPVAVYVPPPPPPGPPPIDLKFFGVETSASGQRQAFLLHGDSVYLASAGDIVMRRYRVISIDARNIQVEDIENNNRQTLPLLTN